MVDIHIKASEVEVGQNVWGQGIVRSLERNDSSVIFNGGAVDEWVVKKINASAIK